MLTNKDYCDYDTCVALKEIGFNEKCHGYYEPLKKCFNTTSVKKCWCNSEVDDIGVIICPTLYEAQKWLREEKNIIVEPIFAYMDEKMDKYYSVPIVTDIRFDDENYTYECDTIELGEFKGYENALLEGIKEAVKILKNK